MKQETFDLPADAIMFDFQNHEVGITFTLRSTFNSELAKYLLAHHRPDQRLQIQVMFPDELDFKGVPPDDEA